MTPTGKFTIAEATEAWINSINAPDTKATPEQKQALIAQILAAAPLAKSYGDTFVAQVNAIRQVIREQAKVGA